jgi:hypothetical protein
MPELAMTEDGKRRVGILILVAAIGFPSISMAAQVDENPSGFVMAADLVVARPLGVVLTALGATTYVVTLPFSLIGGNAGEAGKALVVGPARETFVRCLGCRRIGRKPKLKD